jgi:hypothetical protein
MVLPLSVEVSGNPFPLMKTTAASFCSAVLAGFIASCLFVTPASAFRFLDFDLQTITVTDVTAAGNSWRQPSANSPLYYAAVSGGYYDFGGSKAGERPIPRQLIDETMLKILAKQGYLPAGAQHSADVILIWKWGTLNVERLPLHDGMTSARINERQLLRFLGGAKLGLMSRYGDGFAEQALGPELLFCNGDARNLLDLASDDLYVIAIAAYDVKLRDPKHGVLLWNTRISAPSRGFWMPDALPAMLAIARPYVGRETAKPVWIRATDRFKPDVQLGDLKIMEYLNNAATTVEKAGPSR